MNKNDLKIRLFQKEDTKTIISLWQATGLIRPWNNPVKDIGRKFNHDPELFLVGELDGKIIATVMAGYDGHRGSVFYLGVHPNYQNQGYGQQLMADLERRLLALGCPKINLLVRTGTIEVISFYEKIGYEVAEVVSLGKRLIPDKVTR